VKVITDVIKHRKKIRKSIKKYGRFAEHNFFHYLNCETSGDKNVFFDYGHNKGILMQYDLKNDIWRLFPCGILSPKKKRMKLFFQATSYVLKKRNASKFVVEVSEGVRKEILKKFKTSKIFRVCTYTYILHWPIYNMDQWDPKLKGLRMKKLRNIKNRFYKRLKIRVKNSREVPKEKLKNIFFGWMKKRSVSDSVDKEYYLNLINNNFKGMDIAKTIYVNGKAATITAGWKIPNSNDYYSAIGIVDYSYSGLGEIANIDDLNRLKKKGYRCVDFGGSDKVLLKFKKKV